MRAVVIGVVVLTGSACNSKSPTAPTPAPQPTVVVVTPPPQPSQPTVTNYAGRWLGHFIVEQCGATSGSMDDLVCSQPRGSNPGGVFRLNSTGSLAVNLTQNGNSVSGALQIGASQGTVTGIVSGSQALTLTGGTTASFIDTGLIITTRIIQWQTFLSGAQMLGQIEFQLSATAWPGHALVRARLSNVTR